MGAQKSLTGKSKKFFDGWENLEKEVAEGIFSVSAVLQHVLQS